MQRSEFSGGGKPSLSSEYSGPHYDLTFTGQNVALVLYDVMLTFSWSMPSVLVTVPSRIQLTQTLIPLLR